MLYPPELRARTLIFIGVFDSVAKRMNLDYNQNYNRKAILGVLCGHQCLHS